MPPQVIAVNYLRWDVIYRGPEDDWGAQDVEDPTSASLTCTPWNAVTEWYLGELAQRRCGTRLCVGQSDVTGKERLGHRDRRQLRQDLAPALCRSKSRHSSFRFTTLRYPRSSSVRMDPSSSPGRSLGGSDHRDSGSEIESCAGRRVHREIWSIKAARWSMSHMFSARSMTRVANWCGWRIGYVDRALLPQTPVSLTIAIPPDIARQVSTVRAVTSTYSSAVSR